MKGWGALHKGYFFCQLFRVVSGVVFLSGCRLFSHAPADSPSVPEVTPTPPPSVVLSFTPPLSETGGDRFPPVRPAASPRSDIRNYLIGPGNVLEIYVLGESELSLTVRVNEEGLISYPLLGVVKVSGYTPLEVERQIEALLSQEYLVNPRVTIFVREYGKVSILGQVRKPGSYQLTENLTVTEVIALAGGLTDTADPNGTKVIRVENGEEKVIQVRVKDILQEGDKSQDILLQPGDLIVVEEGFF